MHRRLRALCALILVSFVVLLPVTAHAVTAKQLHDQLLSIKNEYAGAGREYSLAEARVENANDKIDATDARIKREFKKMRNTESYLRHRAYAIYTGGGDGEMLGFLLGATSFEDLVSRLDYAQMIAESDAGLIRRLKDSRIRLDAQRVDLVRTKKQRVVDLKVAMQKRDEVEAKMRAAQKRYDKVMAALQAAMAAEAAAGNRTYQPKAPGGMVFPVRGPHTYIDSWHAPRVGHLHQGTDVMAPNGTPCVAIVSGTVRAHSSGLGGKTITLRGDNGWEFYYAHLNGYAVTGGHVRAGQVIGYVGHTGNAGSCNHLHLQMGPGGHWVNPYPYLRAME